MRPREKQTGEGRLHPLGTAASKSNKPQGKPSCWAASQASLGGALGQHVELEAHTQEGTKALWLQTQNALPPLKTGSPVPPSHWHSPIRLPTVSPKALSICIHLHSQ